MNLLIIIKNNRRPAFTEILSAFDSQFLLTVTQKRLALLREQHRRELGSNVSMERLWSQIKVIV